MNSVGNLTRAIATMRRREGAWLLAFAGLAWIVVFGRLGYPSLLDPDEAHYAQLTREMIRAHSWLVPLLDGSPFIDKPVFFHWLQIASVWLFGESEFALRLPSALAGILLLVVTRWLAAEMFGAVTGNVAAMMFATLPFTFALANVALFDMLYTAFLFAAVACILIAAVHGRERLQYVGYLLLTLAVMTKGPMAVLLVLLWAALGAVMSRTARRAVARVRWTTGLLMTLVLASPWFAYMWVAFDGRFVRDYLLAGNLWYFTGPKAFSTRASDYTFYLRTFAGAFFPWSFVAVGYAIDTGRLRLGRHEPIPPGEVLLFAWVLGIVGFFSLARFKLDWYIFPAAPACCILAARGWLGLARRSATWTRTAVVVVAVTLFAGGVIAAAAIFRLNLELERIAIVLPAALAVGGTVLLLEVLRRRFAPPPSLAAPVAALLVAYGAVVMLGFPVLERSRPTAPMGRWIGRHAKPGSPVGVYGLEDWRASIRYYTDRPLVSLRSAGDIREFLSQYPESFLMMSRRDYLTLVQQGVPIRAIGGRSAIVGRSGKYLRRQVWGRIVVARKGDAGTMQAVVDEDEDLPDPNHN